MEKAELEEGAMEIVTVTQAKEIQILVVELELARLVMLMALLNAIKVDLE
jgi:hypothetical protein